MDKKALFYRVLFYMQLINFTQRKRGEKYETQLKGTF